MLFGAAGVASFPPAVLEGRAGMLSNAVPRRSVPVRAFTYGVCSANRRQHCARLHAMGEAINDYMQIGKQ
jgi:hypothetical protein